MQSCHKKKKIVWPKSNRLQIRPTTHQSYVERTTNLVLKRINKTGPGEDHWAGVGEDYEDGVGDDHTTLGSLTSFISRGRGFLPGAHKKL